MAFMRGKSFRMQATVTTLKGLPDSLRSCFKNCHKKCLKKR
jgi:hypothetical protein